MAILTIRDLDDDVHKRLTDQAERNHRSVQAEARQIIESNVKAGSFAAAWDKMVEAVRRLQAGSNPAGLSMVLPIDLALDLCKATRQEWPERSEELMIHGPRALEARPILGFRVRVEAAAKDIFFA